MKSLKNLTKFSLLSIFSLSSLAANAGNVGSIDIMKVYKQYSLVQEANTILDGMEQSFKRILTTAEAELTDLEKTAKPDEVEKKKNAIQETIDEQVVKVQEEKDLYNTAINRNFQTTLEAIAKEKNYEIILDKGFVIYPITDSADITDPFMVKLEKAPKPKKESK